MAKTRHRTFEIFEFGQEAVDALASKSARVNAHALDPDLWRFHHLDAVVTPSGVTHVTFKPAVDTESQSLADFGKDLVDLADWLTNGSRVLLDFEGVQQFDSAAIARLSEFHGKLQHRGSRLVLCNLDSSVHASFFPHLSANARR